MQSRKNEPAQGENALPPEEAWAAFERAVDAAVKSGPKHRIPKSKTRPASKGQVNKGKTRV